MDTRNLYLKPNVVMEPLMDRWYAWSHLIPPATTARNILERHLKIMESYVRTPQIHAAATKNPAMLGGPFIDYEWLRVDEIRELITETKEKRAHMIEFAQAITMLDDLLRQEGKGYSLEPLYEKIPEPLRGYTELVYDLNHHPAFRLIEPLLYRSSYYNPSSQSLMLSLINQDDRPFVLSTPRLEREGKDVPLQVSFADERIDDLFKMKREPKPYSYVKERLNINDRYDDIFHTFLTEKPKSSYERYTGDRMRWRYFGHACILLETKNFSILLDPVLSYTYENNISRYTYEDLPEIIDYVLITHNHQDHILFETMLQLRDRIQTIVVPRSGIGALQDPSLKLTLQNTGFNNVVELSELETIELDDGEITSIPFFGEHCDLNIQAKAAHLVRLGKHRLLFAADSCNIEPRIYEHIHRLFGDMDALFLGMECDGAPLSWLYGPLMTQPLDRKMDLSRRLAGSNYEQAKKIVDYLNFKEVYVYAMGQEPWLRHVMALIYTEESNPIIASNELLEYCRSRGIVAERLFGEKEIFLD